MHDLSVVIAEDDQKISEIQNRFIEKIEGFEVVGIGNTIAESEQIIDVFQPDLVLLDVYFPDGNGVDLLWKIRQQYKSTDVISSPRRKKSKYCRTPFAAVRSITVGVLKPTGQPKLGRPQ